MNEPIIISQPHGLTLRLRRTGTYFARVELEGGGLLAASEARIDAAAFCDFFTSIAAGQPSDQKKWYYKGNSDENLVLQAALDAENRVLLTVDLLSTADDDTDWQVNGTILLSREQLSEAARVVRQQFGPKGAGQS